MSKSSKQLNKKGNKRGMHPNSLKNLEKRVLWKKGQSGNPKGESLTTLAERRLDEIPNVNVNGKRNEKTWRELIVTAWLTGSIKGNATLFKELLERLEGKVALPLVGKGDKDLIPRAPNVIKLADGGVFEPPLSGNGHDPSLIGQN